MPNPWEGYDPGYGGQQQMTPLPYTPGSPQGGMQTLPFASGGPQPQMQTLPYAPGEQTPAPGGKRRIRIGNKTYVEEDDTPAQPTQVGNRSY
jgi:hypothetical protein